MHLRRPVLSLSLLVLALASVSVRADEAKKADKSSRVAVAKCLTPKGSMLRREAPDKPWVVVDQNESLYTGELIIGLPMSVLESKDGSVQLSVRSDLSGTDTMPIFETAFILAEPAKGFSLSYMLDRGRIELSNHKTKGEAKVRSQIRQYYRELTLVEPGTRAIAQIYGRWPTGVPFTKDAKAEVGPALHLLFLVAKGEVEIQCPDRCVLMKAPPGPAVIEWDSTGGDDPSPRKLEKLPAWVIDDDSSEAAKAKKARIALLQKMLATKPIDEVFEALLKSDDPAKRRVGVWGMAALDNLEAIGKVLATEDKHPDVWDEAVLALRHWIGRGPGQDQKLYDMLLNKKKLTPVQAETMLQLLHTYGDDDIARPETYEMLISYLSNDAMGIRGLAHWHLVRLVPEGKDIGYHPIASKEKRDAAIAKWKKLIPTGKLPMKLKKEEKN